MNRMPVIDAQLRDARPRPTVPMSERIWQRAYDACAILGFTVVLCFVGLMALQVMW